VRILPEPQDLLEGDVANCAGTRVTACSSTMWSRVAVPSDGRQRRAVPVVGICTELSSRSKYERTRSRPGIDHA
jgi:hypothetical protein